MDTRSPLPSRDSDAAGISEALRRVSDARLRRLFDASVVGIIIANNSGAILEANEAFLNMVGYTRDDLENGRLDWRGLTPREWLPLDERAIEEMARRGAFGQYEKEYVRRDGTRLPISVGGARVAGTDDEQICYIVDLSEIRAAESALRRSESRYRILAEALPQIVMLADESRGIVYVNKRYQEYTGITSEEVGTRWREVIHPDDIAEIVRRRATGESYEVEYRLRRASDGAFRWHFARCMKIPDEREGEVWLAAAMDIDDRKRAEESLRFIEKAASRLSESLDLQTTFATVLDLIVPEFGDWASITLRGEDGRITTIAARHRDPEKAHLAREICGIDYFEASHSWGTAEAYRTGRPQLLSHITREAVRAAVKAPYVAALEELGFGSLLALPIVSGGDVIGTIGIVSDGDRRTYTPQDLPSMEELARRASFAIENARRYEREHRVASVLQEAALPRRLPELAGFHFDGYYRAGRQEALIGGDWFDALVLADGRVVVSVGDVAGSGLQAAVLMSNVRQLIRGAAHVYANPMLMFDVADRTLSSEHEESMVTAFVGVIDPSRRSMLYASAGHLPALLRTPDGRIAELEAPGAPLGYRSMAPCESRTAQLPPGSCLLLYTDGLVEWSREIVAGEALLRRRFGEAAAAPSAHPAKDLVERVLPESGAVDDVAALIVTID